jgi:putative MATE family efflux protein
MVHIVTMTGAAGAGLLSIFLVDIFNLYFLGLLNQVEVTAAAGYAGSVVLFAISLGIGFSIAAAALVAPAIGRHDREAAARLTANVHIYTGAVTGALSLGIWWFLPGILTALGAAGRTHELALTYLEIVMPSTPLLSVGMCSAAVLRALGDAKHSMYVTLFGAIATAALDPLFILGFGMGIEGAAIASVISRFVMAGTAYYGVIIVNRMVHSWRAHHFAIDASAMTAIALPAILTSLATPVGNAYVTKAMAAYGDDAVAASAIIGRLMPLAFAVIFALTGAVGPIIGQNRGAGDFGRVRRTVNSALLLTFGYTAAVWLVLAMLHDHVAAFFHAAGAAVGLIGFYCIWITPLTAFLGAQFVANAVFNNLNRPLLSTALNWTRATVATMLLVMVCAQYEGAKGVLLGNGLAGVAIGLLAMVLCYRHVEHMARAEALPEQAEASALCAQTKR